MRVAVLSFPACGFFNASVQYSRWWERVLLIMKAILNRYFVHAYHPYYEYVADIFELLQRGKE